MSFFKKITAAVGAVGMLVGLAACGGGNAASSSTGEIKIGLSAGLDNLDPSRSTNGPDIAIMSQIYETLLDMDPETRELVPKLAESYELIDPKTWQFKLREGIKFSNGEPFNAAAVKYSIERVLDPKTSSPSASQIATVETVEVVNDTTVNIHTKTPDPVLPKRMQPVGGSGRIFIVPPKMFSEGTPEDLASKPVGTGPYVLTNWQKGQSLELSENPEYWGTKPEVKKASFTFIPEAATRVNSLLSSEVDIIQRVPIADVERVDQQDGVRVERSEEGLVHTMLLDTRQAPFDNPKVREAFAKSIDVQGFVDGLLKGYARPLGAPLSPGVKQYDDTIKPYEYDPAAAKQLLIDAGYPDGLPLQTKTSEGRYEADKQIYEFMNKQLNDVGFKVAPQTVEWGRLIRQINEKSAGPFYMVGWDFGEGEASKMNSFLMPGSVRVAELPEYEKLATAAGTEVDEARSTALWKEAQKLVHDSYVIGAMWQTEALWGESDKVEWKPAFGDNLDLDAIRLK